MTRKYRHALVGGTFDHLHKGHKTLLLSACANASKVTIGLTTETLFQHKYLAETIQPYSLREQQLMDFLRSEGCKNEIQIVPLSDIYGTSLTDSSVDVIVVSEETRVNAERINTKREEQNLPPLVIVSIAMVRGEQKCIIRSEKIRNGTMDREGFSYRSFFEQHPSYHLPDYMREQLQQPIGEILKTPKEIATFLKKAPFLTTVGDITTLSLLEVQYPPAVAFIDYRTQRHAIHSSRYLPYGHLPAATLINSAGMITAQAASVYQLAVKNYLEHRKTQYIVVKGEEDLLALPALLLAPLDSFVVYGQNEVGIVTIRVTEEKKVFAKNLLAQFQPSAT